MTVPDWAEVPDGMTWESAPVEFKLDEWLQSMQPSIAGWTYHLPEGFRDDFSRDSLVVVEQTVLDARPDADAELTGPGSLFMETTARYVGEALLRVCGGRWEWSGERSRWPDQPVIVPDTVDGLPIAPFAVVTDIVQLRSGDELISMWDSLDEQRRHREAAEPGWTPVATSTPGFGRGSVPPADGLEAFLAAREHDLAQWAAVSEMPAETWDLSLDSLDALGRMLFEAGFRVEKLTRPAPGSFGWYAMRYVGETLIALRGGSWEWRPNETGVPIVFGDSDFMYIERWMVRREDSADSTYAWPDLHVARVIRRSDPTALRAAAARSGAIDM